MCGFYQSPKSVTAHVTNRGRSQHVNDPVSTPSYSAAESKHCHHQIGPNKHVRQNMSDTVKIKIRNIQHNPSTHERVLLLSSSLSSVNPDTVLARCEWQPRRKVTSACCSQPLSATRAAMRPEAAACHADCTGSFYRLPVKRVRRQQQFNSVMSGRTHTNKQHTLPQRSVVLKPVLLSGWVPEVDGRYRVVTSAGSGARRPEDHPAVGR